MGASISDWHAKPGMTQAKILLCSDTHAKKDSIQKICARISPYSHYDLAIIAGDFSNILYNEHGDAAKESQALLDATSTLEMLEAAVKCPIIYIPGNHEANCMYSNGIAVPYALNLHKTSVKLDENLAIIGFGGSPPGMKEEKGVWIPVWESYPHDSHESFDKDFTTFVEQEMAKYAPDTNLIVLTHVGPANTSTGITPSGIYSGSKGIEEFLNKYNKQAVCAIHGHSHDCQGMVRKYDADCMIINPGPAAFGKFAEICLEKTTEGRWKLTETRFFIA